MLPKLAAAALAVALLAFTLFSTLTPPQPEIASVPLGQVQNGETAKLSEPSPLVAPEAVQEATPKASA